MRNLVDSYNSLHASKKINAGMPIQFEDLDDDKKELLLTLAEDIYKRKINALVARAEEAADNLSSALEDLKQLL
jgi:hypothetical protein